MSAPNKPANTPAPAGSDSFPWGCFLLIAVVYLLSVSGRLAAVDEGVMMAQTRSFLSGHLAVPPNPPFLTPEGVGGLHYSQYGPLVPALWIPGALAARVMVRLAPSFPLKMLEDFAASFTNVAASLAILAYLVQEWRRLGVSGGALRWGVLGVGFGSLLWAYAKMPYSDPWMALGLFAAYCHWRRRSLSVRHAWLAGAWLGVAWLARRQTEMLAPLFMAAFAWETRKEGFRDLGRVMAGWAPFFALQCLYNYGRFGSPFVEKYGIVDTGSFPLFSPENFQRFFCDPWNGFLPFNLFALGLAALGARRWAKADPVWFALPWILLGVSALLLSRYPFWNGGLCFGSRFLLFLIPFLALGLPHALPLRPGPGAALIVLAALSVITQAAGVLVDPLAIAFRQQYVATGTPSVIRNYAGELGRVFGRPQAPLPKEAKGSPYDVHPAFQVPDVWWAHLAYELRNRHSAKPASAPPELTDPTASPRCAAAGWPSGWSRERRPSGGSFPLRAHPRF